VQIIEVNAISSINILSVDAHNLIYVSKTAIGEHCTQQIFMFLSVPFFISSIIVY